MNRPRQLAAVTVALLLVSLAIPSASARSEMFCAPTSDFFPEADTVLHGDIDGDGTTDSASTHARITPDGSCRARLIVETDRRVYRTTIAPLTGLLLVPPALAGLIRIRPGHRLDVAVIVWVGASTGFLDVYALHGQRLRRLSLQAHAYAGSIGQRSGVDCVRQHGARLVASWASINRTGSRYVVERDFYGVRGGSLRPLSRLTERFRLPVDAIGRFPEFAALVPFPSCTVVRGAS
jgi:hypothetical protein